MPLYANTNPANNEDQIEYVIPGPPLQTPSIEGMYFTNIPEKHTTPALKKGPVVVERAPEGIYDLAGQNVANLAAALGAITDGDPHCAGDACIRIVVGAYATARAFCVGATFRTNCTHSL